MIKLYCLCTPSHERLRDEWFLPTLKDEFEIHSRYLRQDGPGEYGDPSFRLAVRKKVEMISEAIESNWGQIFIVSDVDIQFFKPITKLALESMKDRDIMTQNDGPTGFCCGFMVIRANRRTRRLFSSIQALLQRDSKLTEQPAFNAALKNHELQAGTLAGDFFSPGVFLDGRGVSSTRDPFPAGWPFDERVGHCVWVPGAKLRIRRGLVMHHANFTLGLENKLAQLDYVNKVVKTRERDRALP